MGAGVPSGRLRARWLASLSRNSAVLASTPACFISSRVRPKSVRRRYSTASLKSCGWQKTLSFLPLANRPCTKSAT